MRSGKVIVEPRELGREDLRMESLSKEFIINQVKAHKDIIRDSTDRLSNILLKVRKRGDFVLNERDSLAIRKILHEIVSELSMIGGYCDSWTKEYIDNTVNLIGRRTSLTKISYLDALMLEWWTMRINGIVVDFTKTPFRLSEMKPIFSVLKEALSKK